MNPAEYARMAAAADEHWWYRGLRDCIVRAVRRSGLPVTPPDAVLDAGCGSGENLRLLRELLRPRYAGGFDVSPVALDLAARKCPGADLYAGDICRPELHVEELDLVLSCDVISVPGVAAARPGLQRLADALRPGGLLLVNVPAFQWLRSRHDVAVQGTQRFTCRAIRRLLTDLGLQLEFVTYRVWSLFPLIVLRRLPSILWPPRDPSSARSDTELPPRWFNAALTQVLRFENRAMERGCRWLWGSSVFAVARKPFGA